MHERLLLLLDRLRYGSCPEAARSRRQGGDGRLLSEPGSLVPIYKRDHMLGAPSAPITLVEYGDYECRSCRDLDTRIQGFLHAAGDQTRFVFRHYPFGKLHPHAQLAAEAAEAAEAAAAQGKFWEMHRTLFRNQHQLGKKVLLDYAQLLGLELERFECGLRHRVYRDRVNTDFRSGVSNGVYSIPTLFINGFRNGSDLDDSALQDLTAPPGH